MLIREAEVEKRAKCRPKPHKFKAVQRWHDTEHHYLPVFERLAATIPSIAFGDTVANLGGLGRYSVGHKKKMKADTIKFKNYRV